MKTFTWMKWLILCVLLCPLPRLLHAQGIPPDNTNFLTSWTFFDTNSWHTDWDDAPISFTNLSSSTLGDGTALVLSSTSFACLRYKVTEATGTNNIKFDNGTVILWFSPAWASVSQGGTGPGQWGRLVEAGTYTSDASYGFWSIYFDPGASNIFFTVQTNNGNGATYLSAPISWPSNSWHQIALTYSSSNSALYIDSTLVTNGAGVAYWPGPDVLTNGWCIGSDSTGSAQASGSFDDVSTYNIPLSAATIQDNFEWAWLYYILNPLMWENITPAPYTNTASPVFNVITGPGYLTFGGTNAATCVLSTNIWITNFVAKLGTNSSMNLTFLVGGGSDGALYDVFANSILAPSSDTNHPWSWLGQSYHCVTNNLTITNLPNISAFLILGNNLETDGDGLTDAYELLVSKTSPTSADSNSDGIPDGWLVLHRLPTQGSGIAGQDPDFDALSNLSEYLYGTDPQVSQGFSIWLANPAGFSGIP